MFDWITAFIESAGYFGVALLMFAENVFPPIPSELIMPMAGFNASRGRMDPVLVVAFGSAGSLAGAWVWYRAARWLGLDTLRRFAGRHGRWLTLTPRDVDRADHWFDTHGHKAVLLGRLVPAVRTLISVPAGLSDMRERTFLLYSGIGTVIWTALLTAAGYLLGDQYDRVESWTNPVADLVLAAIVAVYLYRVVRWRRPS